MDGEDGRCVLKQQFHRLFGRLSIRLILLLAEGLMLIRLQTFSFVGLFAKTAEGTHLLLEQCNHFVCRQDLVLDLASKANPRSINLTFPDLRDNEILQNFATKQMNA